MDKDTAVDIVAYRLGNRTDLDTRIAQEMSLIQTSELERAPLLPWFLVSETLSAETTADEERVSVPTGFLREYEDGALWRFDDTADEDEQQWIELKKEGLDRLTSSLGVTLDGTGAPLYYSLTGTYFRLRPVPDDAYTLKIKAYIADDTILLLDGDQTNQWLTHAPDLLIAETVYRMGANQLQMHDRMISRFMQELTTARSRYINDNEARIHTNRRYVMDVSQSA